MPLKEKESQHSEYPERRPVVLRVAVEGRIEECGLMENHTLDLNDFLSRTVDSRLKRAGMTCFYCFSQAS